MPGGQCWGSPVFNRGTVHERYGMIANSETESDHHFNILYFGLIKINQSVPGGQCWMSPVFNQGTVHERYEILK